MRKSKLRIYYKMLRSKLCEDDLEDKSISIANNLLSLSIWEHKTFHIFMPIKHLKEVDTLPILTLLQSRDKNVVISKSNFKSHSMTHVLLTDNLVIKKNSYGIPEPTDGIEITSQLIDVIFVPLLAYDINGNRVGYGKGFYDKFLSDCKSNALKVGLSLFPPTDVIIDTNEFDIPLDYVVTPKKIFEF